MTRKTFLSVRHVPLFRAPRFVFTRSMNCHFTVLWIRMNGSWRPHIWNFFWKPRCDREKGRLFERRCSGRGGKRREVSKTIVPPTGGSSRMERHIKERLFAVGETSQVADWRCRLLWLWSAPGWVLSAGVWRKREHGDDSHLSLFDASVNEQCQYAPYLSKNALDFRFTVSLLCRSFAVLFRRQSKLDEKMTKGAIETLIELHS